MPSRPVSRSRTRLLDAATLEQSEIVANAAMNRDRNLAGINSYARELGQNPVEFLLPRLQSTGHVAWLDLCCGTGRALVQTAVEFRQLGHSTRVSLVGVDLVPFFQPVPANLPVRLIAASLTSWSSAQSFDLITCVHGLHYVADKLDLIRRSACWLAPDGLLLANLDLDNLRLADAKPAPRRFARVFREAGISYDSRTHLLAITGHKTVEFPTRFLGATDIAGPNYSHQPAVHSCYAIDS